MNEARIDAQIASALHGLPSFTQWRPKPLPYELLALIEHADEQTLRTMAVEALRRALQMHERDAGAKGESGPEGSPSSE